MTSKSIISLKSELDKIDEEAITKALKGFYESRLAIENGMWEKGKAINVYTGGKTVNWRALERQTGRDDCDLKRWFELYQKYPNFKDYEEKYAKPRAEAWTRKALSSINRQKQLVSFEDLEELQAWPFKYDLEGRRVVSPWEIIYILAVEVKLRAERKAGSFLKEMEKNKGGRPSKTADKLSGVSTLKDLNIEYKESERWQRIAEIPEDKFEQHISEAKEEIDATLATPYTEEQIAGLGEGGEP